MAEIPWPEHGSPPRSQAIYHDRQHHGEIIDAVERGGQTYTVIRCSSCLLIHVVPLPDEAWLRTYYQEQFFQRSKPDYVARYEEDRAWWTWVHTQTLALAEAVLEKPGRVLDIGAGPGLFLDTARARGWTTFGLEPNEDLAETLIARGHDTIPMTLAAYRGQTPLQPGVHLLHLYEVLEHQPDPQEFLLQAGELLAPGGLLHVVMPADYNQLQLAWCHKTGAPHWWVQPPEHLTYFTPKTLQLLLRRCGFDIIDLHGTFPLEFFLFMGFDYINQDAIGRQVHRMRMNLELSLSSAGLYGIIGEWYEQNMANPYSGSIGREIVCLARKREG